MDKRIMSYRGHVIWANGYGFAVALKGDGTDTYFRTLDDAMEAIDTIEEEKR